MTLKKLLEYVEKHNVPDNAEICVYTGGPDAQNWKSSKCEHGKGAIIKNIYGKHSAECIADADNFDDDEIKKYKKTNYLLISIW